MGWEDLPGGFRRRVYESYEQYIKVQGSKLGNKAGFAAKASAGMYTGMIKRINQQKERLPEAGTVICLGARLGGEVSAFLQCGYFAVGVDVNPGEKNEFVLYGDFHELSFPAQSTDIVYTNSLDHVLDIDKVLGEVTRVLKPGGIFYVEAKGGVAEPDGRSARSDGYDCMEWLTLEGFVDYIASKGFCVLDRYKTKGFTPWGIVYRKI